MIVALKFWIRGIFLVFDTEYMTACHLLMNIGLDIFNTLMPRQNRSPFADDIFKCIFLNENVWISVDISLKFIRKGLIDHIPALV